jgi:putative nucleotidyltransferase with HDIG domain
MAKDLRSIVRNISELPTLPQVVTVILSLIDSPDSSAEDINKVMEKDPSLVGKILKLVNSAYYGLPNKVNSVRQAIVILGFSTVKSLAISASVFDMFDSSRETGFDREQFWTHSIGCGCVSRLVGNREAGVDQETSFVVGLLHDIGKMVLDQYAPREFDTIIQLARARSLSFYDAEREVLQDTNHAEIGAWVAEQWKLSEELTEAIRHHHEVGGLEDHSTAVLAAVCRFSNFICHRRQVGSSGNFCQPVMDGDAWARLSIDKEELPKLVEAVNQELAKSSAFLNMAVGGG